LTFSTKAGGKVFSMPNKIPIFFITKSPVEKTNVILSGVADEQSESAAQSKDPYPPVPPKPSQDILAGNPSETA
jgi:hypothetical protein